MQSKMIFLFALLMSYPALALNCDAVRWPFSTQISQVKPAELEKIPRQFLYNYLFFEVSRAPEKRIPGLAQKLFYYLGNSELNNDMQALVEALDWAADLNTAKPRVIPEAEICSLVKKTLGSGFENSRKPTGSAKATQTPNSSKKSRAGKSVRH